MNVSGTTVSATGHKGGLGDGLYDRAGARPDLDLDFARTKSLKDRVSKEDLITFTRSSGTGYGATYVDENGLVKVAPVNLLKYSEQLDQAAWVSGSSITPNNVVAPDGTTTADTWSYDSTRYGFYNNSASSWMSGHNQVLYPFTITDKWVRYSISLTTDSGQTSMWIFPLRTNDNNNYVYQTGITVVPNTDYVFSAWYKKVGTKVYVWGCQLEKGSVATEYIPTTDQISGAPRFTHDPETLESKGLLIEEESTNLIPYSQDFSQSEWSKEDVSLDSNTTATTAPDGTNTASLVTATGSTSTVHRIKEGGFSLNTNPYTLSAFIKFNTSQHVLFKIFKQNQGTGQGNIIYKRVKLNTDGSLTIGSGGSGTLIYEKYPNGWYRFLAISGSSTGTHNGSLIISLLQNDNTAESFVANSESLYVWGAQLEQNTFGTSYIPTSGSTVTRSPDLASIEGDNFGTYRKNLLNHTVPANHTFSSNSNELYYLGQGSLTDNVDIAPDGTYSASLYTENTANDPHLMRWQATEAFDATTDYTWSCYLKNPSTNGSRYATMTQYGATYVVFDLQTGTILKAYNHTTRNVQNSITPVGELDSDGKPVNGWYRCSTTMTSPSNPTNYHKVYVGTHAGGLPTETFGHSFTGDGVSGILVWGAQVEKSSTMTEYIPSTDTYTNRQSNATFVDGNGIIRTSYANRLLYSEDFSRRVNNVNSVSTTNPYSIGTTNNFIEEGSTTTAPDGSTVPWYNFTGFIQQILTNQPADNYTVSVYLKTDIANGCVLELRKPDGAGVSEYISVTTEWKRFSVTATRSTAGDLKFLLDNRDNITASTVKIAVWGAQLVRGSEAADYYKTTDTISGPPRYSYDPETLTPTGLYLEPEATNLLRNSQDLTTSPWTETNSATFTPNTITAPDGTLTAGKVNFNDAGWGALFTNSDGDLAWLVDPTTTSLPTLTTEWKRYTIGTSTVPSNAGSSAIVLYALYKTNFGTMYQHSVPVSPGSTYTYSAWLKEINNEIYYWGPQFELGNVATSYIPTTNATATRSADIFTSTATEVLDRANGTKPAFFTTDGISIFVNGKLNNVNGASHRLNRIVEFDFKDFQLVISTDNSNKIKMQHEDPTDINGGSVTFDNTKSFKAAARHSLGLIGLGDSRVAANGSLGNDDFVFTSGTGHTMSKSTYLNIGKRGSGTVDPLNGTINRLAIWKTPFVDSKLQRITS